MDEVFSINQRGRRCGVRSTGRLACGCECSCLFDLSFGKNRSVQFSYCTCRTINLEVVLVELAYVLFIE